ncbi:MAG: hypothetical protein JXA00_02105 [Candidatus Thermoplasmatota archaeon]|nr:hypothetical protein [Candidatus Thermoplasmatota archaeon]
MAREFTRNMFIMLVSIMVGVVIITFFAADIVNRTALETLQSQHNVEIIDINSRFANFLNNTLQGCVKMDLAREQREVANLNFTFAFFWFTNALYTSDINLTRLCIDNCTDAMEHYLVAYTNFSVCRPFFEEAQAFTNKSWYLNLLNNYIRFSYAGQEITMLRYNASLYLRQAAENLSLGKLDNVSLLWELFNETQEQYTVAEQQYNSYKGAIDGYLFMSEFREQPDT